jgi:uncharacterized protein YxeA
MKKTLAVLISLAVVVGLFLVAWNINNRNGGSQVVQETLWKFSVVASDTPTAAQVQSFFQDTLKVSATVTFDSGNGYFLATLPSMNESQHENYLNQLKTQYHSFMELGFQSQETKN